MFISHYDSFAQCERAVLAALVHSPVAVLIDDSLDVASHIETNNLNALAALSHVGTTMHQPELFTVTFRPDTVHIGLRTVDNGQYAARILPVSLQDARHFFTTFDRYNELVTLDNATIPTLAAWLTHFTERLTYAFVAPGANEALFLHSIDVPSEYETLCAELETELEVYIAHPGGALVHLTSREDILRAAENPA